MDAKPRLKRGWYFIKITNWWTTHVPASMNVGRLKVGLKYEAIGGMASWRGSWNTIEGPGEKSLLGVQPWQNRELRRSPPRKGDQEWIKYRGG